MAMDLKWLLSADDKASPVFDKVHQAGKQAANGIEGAFGKLKSGFDGLTGLVGGLAAVAGGMMFKSIISQTVSWNLEAAKLATTLGMTTEQASIYKVAAHTLGIEQDVLESAGLRLAKTLGTNEDAFTKLGVKTRDQSGHFRSTAEIMPEVTQKLGEMKAGTDRNVVGIEIFGKAWGQSSRLLKLTSAAMDEAAETAKRLHLIVGDEGVAQSKEYKKNLNELELVGKSLAIQFGGVLLPYLVKFGAYIGENAPVLVEAFRLSLEFVKKTLTTLGEWLGLMAFRFYSFGAIVKDALSGNWKELKNDWNAMAAAGDDFNKKTKENWSNWDAPKQKIKEVKGAQKDLNDTTEDYAKQLKSVTGEFDKYVTSLKNVGKENITLAHDSFTEGLQRQQEVMKETGRIFGDLQAPVRAYLAVIDNVAATQKRMIADTRTSLEGLINGSSGKMSTGGKDSKTNLAGDLRKEMEKLKLVELEMEKQLLTDKYKAWEEYYKSLKSLVVEKDKEIKAAHLELMNNRIEMDKAAKDLNAPQLDDSWKDQITRYYEQIESWRSRIAEALKPKDYGLLSSGNSSVMDALKLKDFEQAQKSIRDIKDEIMAFQKANPQGVFEDISKSVRSFADGMGVFDRSEVQTTMVSFKENVISSAQQLSDLNSVLGLAGTALEDMGQKKIKTLNDELLLAQGELTATRIKIDDTRSALKLLDDQITQQTRKVTLSVEDFATPALRGIKGALEELTNKKYIISVGYADGYSLPVNAAQQLSDPYSMHSLVGRIVPASQNTSQYHGSPITIAPGAIQINVPPGTSASMADAVIRAAVPKILRQIEERRRAA